MPPKEKDARHQLLVHLQPYRRNSKTISLVIDQCCQMRSLKHMVYNKPYTKEEESTLLSQDTNYDPLHGSIPKLHPAMRRDNKSDKEYGTIRKLDP